MFTGPGLGFLQAGCIAGVLVWKCEGCSIDSTLGGHGAEVALDAGGVADTDLDVCLPVKASCLVDWFTFDERCAD